jgi:hypothetical protein
MEKVGFLCGLAPLRDKKIVKELPKAGGKQTIILNNLSAAAD